MTEQVVQETETTNPVADPVVTNPNGNGAAPVGSVLEAEGEGAPATSTWPEDWRSRLAGNDEQFLKIVNRYSSPETFAKAYGSLRQQLAAGELTKRLPENASEQETAEWRAQMGLPEKPDGYQLTRVMGHEWSEEDKPMLGAFMEVAHGAHMNQRQVDAALDWYGKFVETAKANQFEGDTKNKQDLEDALRTEWGPEFRSNVGLLKRYIETDVPDGLGGDLLSARLENGKRLIDDPRFAKWMAGLARDQHGDASFISGDGGVTATADRRRAIENIMHTDPNTYWKDKAMQAEYLKIVQRDEKRR